MRPAAVRHPDTRMPPLVFGMVLFLASELMLFGSLFGAYFSLRNATPVWPPADVHLRLGLTLVATVILTASSATMHAGVAGLRRGSPAALRRWVVVTMALGVVFLGIKAYELATEEFSVGSHAYGSLFFTMLGAHGLHLAAGVVLLGLVLARRAPLADDGEPAPFVEATAYYWHFVDAVWLAIFATLYVVR